MKLLKSGLASLAILAALFMGSANLKAASAAEWQAAIGGVAQSAAQIYAANYELQRGVYNMGDLRTARDNAVITQAQFDALKPAVLNVVSVFSDNFRLVRHMNRILLQTHTDFFSLPASSGADLDVYSDEVIAAAIPILLGAGEVLITAIDDLETAFSNEGVDPADVFTIPAGPLVL